MSENEEEPVNKTPSFVTDIFDGGKQ